MPGDVGVREPLTGRVVCVGEALVDLIAEQPSSGPGPAPSFTPHVGGSLVNIAVAASRFGAGAELIGGAGEDDWGRWLRDRVADLGVDVARFALDPGGVTARAIVAVSSEGEPVFSFEGGARHAVASAASALEAAFAGPPGVLVVGTDTVLGEGECEVTFHASELARARGWPVLCDPNLRPGRWDEDARMLAVARALVAAAEVVKCNADEVIALSGEREPEAGALSLLSAGPSAVVVTRGGRGAFVVDDRGLTTVEPVELPRVVDATGAGDCVAGVLAAALAAGLGVRELDRALGVAMGAAAGVLSHWGASAGLPAPESARAALAAVL